METAENMIDTATKFGGKAQTKADLAKLMQDYARLMIEKDRERVKKAAKDSVWVVLKNDVVEAINNVEIKLD